MSESGANEAENENKDSNDAEDDPKLAGEEAKGDLNSAVINGVDDSNPAEDNRNLRRIIAEDPEWNLATVPLLSNLSVDHIIQNFAFNSTMLRQLTPKQCDEVLARIPTNLPLKVTAPLIREESYWTRVCKARWTLCDVSQYEGSWKRMYLERNLEEIIESFIPEKTDGTRLAETLALSAPFIKRLNIKQLLPPIDEEVKEMQPAQDDSSEIESEVGDPPIQEHFDFSGVLPQLHNLVELRISYGVKNCGMNFEWNLFQFTSKDCLMIAKCIAAATQLQVFQLHRSRVDCDKCRLIISHLLDHPNLLELDMSHNSIGDRGARALGKFINGHSQLVKMILSNNCIGPAGAQAIAHALTKNSTVSHLDLRLNNLGDDGGQAICKALLKNTTLINVNMAANNMTEPTAAILSQVVAQNQFLNCLDVSNNRLGPDGGKQLQEGMEDNSTLEQLDLRFTECGQEAEFSISLLIEANREKKRQVEQTASNLRNNLRPNRA